MKKREINMQRAMLDLEYPLDYDLMMQYLDILCERYDFISLTYMGESIFGRGIPMINIGEGKKNIFYIGAQSATDFIGSIALLRFINEYCEIYKANGRIFNYSVPYLFATRRISVIPMLNPDGVDICINGVREDNILRDRLLSMNGGREDFSEWKANARGVSLSQNYNGNFSKCKTKAAEMGILSGCPSGYGGEMPESEPESGALAANIRYASDVKAVISLRGERERVFYKTDKRTLPRAKSIASAISRMSGYSLQSDTDSILDGSLDAWCINDMEIPAFSVCYGEDKSGEDFALYAKLREMLFTLPALI